MMDNHSDRTEVIQALADGQGKSIRYSNTTGYEMLYYARLITAEKKPIAVLRLLFRCKLLMRKLPACNERWQELLSWSRLWRR